MNHPSDAARSAYGADLQPFAGITTFMRCPATRDLAGVDVAVVGLPYDSGTSYRSGARFGPRKIREASLMLWGYNNPLAVRPLDVLRVVDFGDADVIPPSILDTMANVEAEVGAALEAGVTVLALGGDHRYGWLPRLTTGAILRLALGMPGHKLTSIEFTDEVRDTMWPTFFAGQTRSDRSPAHLQLPDGAWAEWPLDFLGSARWGTSATPEFWDWFRSLKAAKGDQLIITVLDGEARRYSLAFENMSGQADDGASEIGSPWSETTTHTHQVTLGKLGLEVGRQFLYLFDYGDSHEFDLRVTAHRPSSPPGNYPRVVGRRGKAPEQYPATD